MLNYAPKLESTPQHRRAAGMRLGDFIDSLQGDDESEELRAALEQEIAKAEIKAGQSFRNVEIGSREAMGNAGGLCIMCTGEIKVREDLVTDVGAVRQHAAATLFHEGTHKGTQGANGRVRLEGVTELATVITMGGSPVPAYREKTEHARHIVRRLGLAETLKLAAHEDAHIMLIQACAAQDIACGMDSQNALASAAEDVKLAA